MYLQIDLSNGIDIFNAIIIYRPICLGAHFIAMAIFHSVK